MMEGKRVDATRFLFSYLVDRLYFPWVLWYILKDDWTRGGQAFDYNDQCHQDI